MIPTKDIHDAANVRTEEVHVLRYPGQRAHLPTADYVRCSRLSCISILVPLSMEPADRDVQEWWRVKCGVTISLSDEFLDTNLHNGQDGWDI